MPNPPACNDSTAVCVHPDGSPWSNHTEMCPTCTLTCPAFGGWDFCDEAAAGDMIMRGFVSYSFRDTSDTPCVILFFSGWVLGTRWKFWLGAVFVFILAFVLEAVATLRPPSEGKIGTFLVPLTYMLRMSLAYMVMLCAMTFCVEIFVAVILGLGVGHGVFRHLRKDTRSSNTICCSHGGDSILITHELDRVEHAVAAALEVQAINEVITLRVDGMTCGSCTNTVTRALTAVPGVVSALVSLPRRDLPEGRASVSIAAAGFSGVSTLIEAVDQVGFDAQQIRERSACQLCRRQLVF